MAGHYTYTLDDYKALKEAIASGAREVWYGDKRVAYRTQGEMLALLEIMESELSIKRPPRRNVPSYDSGLK